MQKISQKTLQAACLQYGIEPSSTKLIRDNQNLIFDCGDKVLRLTPSWARGTREIETELDYLSFLYHKKLPVVQVIPSKKQGLFEKIVEEEGFFTAVCFEKIQGEKVLENHWNADHFENLGRIVGKFHQANQGYTEKPDLQYLHWDEIIEHQYDHYLPKDERNLAALFAKLSTQFQQYPKSRENYGLIHYDIHHGNYLMRGGQAIVFDFEMTCKAWYVFDVASVLYYALFVPLRAGEDGAAFSKLFMRNFWKGYEEHHQIAAEEKEWIPAYLLYRDLMVLAFLNKIFAGKILSQGEENYLKFLEKSIEKRQRI